MKRCLQCSKDFSRPANLSQDRWLNRTKFCSKECAWKNRARPTSPIRDCTMCGRPVRTRGRCGSCNTKIRRYRTKKAAINLLGGKCVRCGYNKNFVALEFHHPNSDKDFNIGSATNKSWESIKDEILKCELICSNCHRIEHCSYDSKWEEESKKYQGRVLD